MERPYILHMFTPGKQMSPFDINMAADAGYQMVVPYCDVGLDAIAGLTQDTIFSRGPQGRGAHRHLHRRARRGARRRHAGPLHQGRWCRRSWSRCMADPSGAYTTAAAMVASVEAALKKQHGQGLDRQRVAASSAAPGRSAASPACSRRRPAPRSRCRAATASTRPKRRRSETGTRFGVTVHGVARRRPRGGARLARRGRRACSRLRGGRRAGRLRRRPRLRQAAQGRGRRQRRAAGRHRRRRRDGRRQAAGRAPARSASARLPSATSSTRRSTGCWCRCAVPRRGRSP